MWERMDSLFWGWHVGQRNQRLQERQHLAIQTKLLKTQRDVDVPTTKDAGGIVMMFD